MVAGSNAQQITADAMRNQTENFLIQLTTAAAEKNDIILVNVQKETSSVADFAKNIFENPNSFSSDVWKFDNHVVKGENGQYSNSQEDVSSVFIPNYIKLDNDLKNEMELSAFLDYMFPAVLRNDSNAFAIYFVGLQGELRYYPNVGIETLVPPDIDFTKLNFFNLATPENNSQRKVVWTPLYADVAGLGLMITASAPIYTKQKGFIGVIDIDVTLKSIITNIESYNPIENSYAFLIDKDGFSIALPEQAYKDILGRSREENESQTNLNNLTNDFSSVISKMKESSSGFQNVSVGNKELFVAYAPLNDTNFSLGIVVEKSIALKTVNDLKKDVGSSTQQMIYTRFLPAGMLILLVTFILVFFFSKSITKPIKKLTKNVEDISMGKLDVEIDPKLKESKDEIGALARAFDRTIVSLKLAMKQTAPELKKESDSLRKLLEEKEKAEREMKESQEKLKASEERFRKVAENAGEFILEVDKDGLYTYASPAIKKILGYEPEEIIGKKHFYDLFAPDVKEELKKTVIEGFTKKETFRNFVNPNVRKDGSIAILETSGTPVLDNKANLIGYIGSGTDVTERNRTEEALREKEKNFGSIFEDAKVLLVWLDTTGKILDVNPLIKDIVGYEPEEIIGKNFTKVGFIEARNIPKTVKIFVDFATGKDSSKLRELEFKHKNGKKVILELYAEVIKKGGKTESILIVGRDVTNRKEKISMVDEK